MGYTRSHHGLGKAGYEALLARQEGACAICRMPFTGAPGRRPAVDHDHRHCPGAVGCPACVRGALCNSCNLLLQKAKDDVDLLTRAIEYLSSRPVPVPSPMT